MGEKKHRVKTMLSRAHELMGTSSLNKHWNDCPNSGYDIYCVFWRMPVPEASLKMIILNCLSVELGFGLRFLSKSGNTNDPTEHKMLQT